MNATATLSKTRGIKNLLLRIISIFRRFGFTPKSFENKLERYFTAARSLGCRPTFAITAVTLARHPAFIRKLSRQGAELSVHGYIHTDYGLLSAGEQKRHFQKAIKVFQKCRIPFVGFRAPFLRINGNSPETLGSLGFVYDSSHPIHWEVIERSRYAADLWGQYDRLLEYYKQRESRHYLSLPRYTGNFLEIPVSIPDDEMMIDRLGITDKEEISRVWLAMLQKTYERGELFTMSFHPERVAYCEEAMRSVLRRAGELRPHVWVATLREIAAWWAERDKYSLELTLEGGDRYRVKARCNDRATILVRNCRVNTETTDWGFGYRAVPARDFVLESPLPPVVGVGLDSSPAVLGFLKREGYLAARSSRPEDYGIHLGHLEKFREIDEKPLADVLEKATAPLVRYWRWPDAARSALSVTGDIDSITLTDFGLRILENFVQSIKSR
jgi:peptidoglycan/xylan/chitin deacetylase (PgdA/CDA1 family)